MRDQFFQVQNPGAHTRDRWWPGVTVTVDEPEIDLFIVSMFSYEADNEAVPPLERDA